MATPLYLGSNQGTLIGSVDPVVPIRYVAGLGMETAPSPGFWNGDADGKYTDSSGHNILSPTRLASGGPLSHVIDTVAGPISGLLGGPHVSDALAAGFTLSGTVTWNIWGEEQLGDANIGIVARLYRLQPDGTLTLVCADTTSSELPVTTLNGGPGAAAKNWTATPTSTSFEKGDRIVVWVGIDDAGGTMLTGRQAQLWWAAASAGVKGDSYVQLSESGLTFQTTAPSGSTVYLRDTASDIADQGAGNDEKTMWTTAGGTSAGTTGAKSTVAGPIPSTAQRWTKTAGGNTLEWFTPRLNAFTLAGLCRVVILATQSGAAAACMVAEIARVDSDGSNPVVWARELLAEGQYLPGDGSWTPRISILAGHDLAVSTGQRLRCRLYLDENFLLSFSHPVQSGFTATVTYDGNHAVYNATPGWTRAQLTFEQTITDTNQVSQTAQLPWEAEGVLSSIVFPPRVNH